MWKPRLFTLVVCSLILVSALSPAAFASSRFTDAAGHWASAEIEAGAQAGWISGYEDGSFRPENQVTRAEFIKMAVAAAGLAPQPGATNSFMDVQGHWLSTQGWLGAALANGLLDQPLYKAFSLLDPDRPITRCEATVIAVRLAQPGTGDLPEGSLAFSDAGQVPANMTAFVSRSVALGIITGFPDNTFGPSGLLTRSQAVVIIGRALHVVPGSLTVYCNLLMGNIYVGNERKGSPHGSYGTTVEGILPGTYTVKVTSDGWADWTKQVSVVAGKTTVLYAYLALGSGNGSPSRNETITPDSAASYGSLTVYSNLLLGNIYVGGEPGGPPQGSTGRTIRGILPGTYTVKVTSDGWKDWTGQVTINSGQTTTVNAILTQR